MELYPEAHCELVYRNPFELLIAVMLSAQCTDQRVNQITPALFARYPDARALSGASLADVETLIRTAGLYRNKARNIVATSQKLVSSHKGEVPKTLDDLVALPGVARKTANVVLGVGYGIPTGIAVDTHVQRLSSRLSLSSATDPVKIEMDLLRLIDQSRWIQAGHQLIWHGRRVCFAKNPSCASCTLAPLCPKGRSAQ